MRLWPLEAATARITDLRAVFEIRIFRIYQIGNAASTLGFWMQRVAIGWVAWELTGSEAFLGLIAFAELFPAILTGLLGGVLADKWPRVSIMLWGQGAAAGVSAAFWFAHVMGMLSPWLMVSIVTLLGALAGLILPARLAMASALVPKDQLPTALAVNSTAFNLARFVGPALAGLILVWSGAGVIFAIALLCYLTFVSCLLRIPPGDRTGGPKPAATGAVLKGLWAAGLVLAVMAVQFVQGLALRPASELFPAFADEVFGRGAVGLGMLNAALGIGAILGALTLSGRRPDVLHRQVFGGSLIFAASLLAFAVVGPFWLALGVLVIQGAAMSSSNIAALAYVQRETPQDRLGRVLSVYALVFRVAPALGALALGLGAEAFGLRAATVAAAMIGAAATLLILFSKTGRDTRHA